MKILSFALALITLSTFAPSGLSMEASGTLDKGLRILEIPSSNEQLNFKVYRGDYIKFKYDNKLGKMTFSAPTLKYKDEVTGNTDQSKYFKMKQKGEFPFTLGKKTGKLTVIEYDKPNYKAISANEGMELIKTVKPLILDVRTPGEYSRGHIEGSVLIPVGTLQSDFKKIEDYKNQDIFVYCASGNRSTVASKILADKGFKRIYNLRHGIGEWQQKGHPVKK